MKTTVIRHVPFDSLGALHPALEDMGAEITILDPWKYAFDIKLIENCDADLLIILGGAPGAYQVEAYPFLKTEIDLIAKRAQKGLATLGVCLGAQMMAKAIGGSVFPGPMGPEKGWARLKLTEAGQKSALKYFAPEILEVLVWHGDTFTLPTEAVILAKTDLYTHAFEFNKCLLGIQFHPEMNRDVFDGYIIGSADASAAGKIDLDSIRANSAQNLIIQAQQTDIFFRAWLKDVML